MARRPATPADIPVLTEVIVPGQRAARGQTTKERRASDVDTADPHSGDAPDDPLYDEPFDADALALDIEGAIDRVLDTHSEQLREALREEFERLLDTARRRAR